MIDNVTGKATRIDVRPLTLEGMLRTTRRDRPLLLGYLLVSLLAAARKLWPDFQPEKPKLTGHPLLARKQEEAPEVPFKPTWRRPRGQSLAEYALILALIAVVAVVSLIFLGNQIAGFLSAVGASI